MSWSWSSGGLASEYFKNGTRLPTHLQQQSNPIYAESHGTLCTSQVHSSFDPRLAGQNDAIYSPGYLCSGLRSAKRQTTLNQPSLVRSMRHFRSNCLSLGLGHLDIFTRLDFRGWEYANMTRAEKPLRARNIPCIQASLSHLSALDVTQQVHLAYRLPATPQHRFGTGRPTNPHLRQVSVIQNTTKVHPSS